MQRVGATIAAGTSSPGGGAGSRGVARLMDVVNTAVPPARQCVRARTSALGRTATWRVPGTKEILLEVSR